MSADNPHAQAATIRVNGQEEALPWPTMLDTWLAARGITVAQTGVAVARNGRLVRRADWPATALEPGDAVEIVHARQGG